MRIEGEDCNLGLCNTKVAFQTLIHQHNLIHQEIMGQRIGDVFQGKVIGHDTDADAVTNHEHET